MAAFGEPVDDKAELPSWAWLWLPPCLILAELAFRIIDEPLYRRLWHGEDGPMENGTVVLALPAIFVGILLARQVSAFPYRWVWGWMILTALGAFYFAGEELSWGQHWFGWATPETVGRLNDQGETNLHNMSSWLDQKPRLMLELWVLFGGILYQPWRRWRDLSLQPGHWAYWIMPTPIVLPTALLAILVKLPERLKDWFDIPFVPPLDIRHSETQEFYFALFLSLYLCSVYARLRRHQRMMRA